MGAAPSGPTGPSPAGDGAPVHYCPIEMLARFTLLMAGHGHCVSTDMMLGDHGYAVAQLARARALHDAELAEVAQRLADYFADRRQPAVRTPGTA